MKNVLMVVLALMVMAGIANATAGADTSKASSTTFHGMAGTNGFYTVAKGTPAKIHFLLESYVAITTDSVYVKMKSSFTPKAFATDTGNITGVFKTIFATGQLATGHEKIKIDADLSAAPYNWSADANGLLNQNVFLRFLINTDDNADTCVMYGPYEKNDNLGSWSVIWARPASWTPSAPGGTLP